MAESPVTDLQDGQGATPNRLPDRFMAWGRGLVDKLNAATADGVEADEEDYIRRVARELGVHPILTPDDLKYQGVQPLGDRHRDLQKWINRVGGGNLCIRIRPADSTGVQGCWIITDKPASPEVETIQNLLRAKGWEVEVHPAKRSMVASAMDRDLALSPTEVEETFRNLLRESLRRNASDIHFEVRGDQSQTRLRINGEMQVYSLANERPLPVAVIYQIGNYLFNRLAKRGARQFVTNQPLNAAAQTNIDDVTVALRFATAPDIRGYDIFVRVWKPDSDSLALEELGYSLDQQRYLREAIAKPYGVIVFSGPTGSGKSTSLTALLDSQTDSDRVRRKIISLEEPVERELEHVTHVSVNAIVEEGGWKALLGGLNRWDSNINVLGEIKDSETASAIQDLATAGKLSLTTLHASNVLSIPTRMEDLGVEHKLLVDPNFLLLLVNQRLVPELCPDCKIGLGKRLDALMAEKRSEERPDIARAAKLHAMRRFSDLSRRFGGDWQVRGPGCETCDGTGIISRVLVGEMVWMDDHARAFVRKRDWDGWRRHLAGTGWRDIHHHALEHVRAGRLDPVDVERLVAPLDEPEAGT